MIFVERRSVVVDRIHLNRLLNTVSDMCSLSMQTYKWLKHTQKSMSKQTLDCQTSKPIYVLWWPHLELSTKRWTKTLISLELPTRWVKPSWLAAYTANKQDQFGRWEIISMKCVQIYLRNKLQKSSWWTTEKLTHW